MAFSSRKAPLRSFKGHGDGFYSVNKEVVKTGKLVLKVRTAGAAIEGS